MNFSPKRASETEVFTVDFAPLLPPGVTIVSAEWSITAIDGQDPASISMIEGVPTINGATVSQLITRGVPGLRYAPICIATRSDGQTQVLPEYGEGYLDITL